MGTCRPGWQVAADGDSRGAACMAVDAAGAAEFPSISLTSQ